MRSRNAIVSPTFQSGTANSVGDVRAELEKQIQQKKTDAERLQKQIEEQNQIQEREQNDTDKDKIAVELFERRSKVWRSFLERESVASIVGALLLIVLVFSMIIAMFQNIAPSDIVNNSLMLVLGYFFGQTISKASPNENDKE